MFGCFFREEHTVKSDHEEEVEESPKETKEVTMSELIKMRIQTNNRFQESSRKNLPSDGEKQKSEFSSVDLSEVEVKRADHLALPRRKIRKQK